MTIIKTTAVKKTDDKDHYYSLTTFTSKSRKLCLKIEEYIYHEGKGYVKISEDVLVAIKGFSFHVPQPLYSVTNHGITHEMYCNSREELVLKNVALEREYVFSFAKNGIANWAYEGRREFATCFIHSEKEA